MISCYVLAVVSIVFYLYAFFPTAQNKSSSIVNPPEVLMDINLNRSHVYSPIIDRLVIVVIDALRVDFISDKNTPFISTATKHAGCSVLVKVESPTVTLPRIKALTTGSVPQFIDVILNLMSTETFKDSILHRAAEKGKKIVFYGDDTWLKIYPHMFIRSEGTSSFYVNDYTEVDNNVTRNVDKELQNNDWDIMVLHYLGLDHIGHISGPFSPLVHPKLQEMDIVIKKIFESTERSNKKTLILITGDHGMKDSGGHGGTTYAETRVPLILLGIPCENDSIAQTDISVILSAIMGLPLPADSIGRISSHVLSSYHPEKLLYALRYNILALQTKIKICDDLFDKATNMHYAFLINNNYSSVNEIKILYEHCIKEMSDTLIISSVKQNDHVLVMSCISIICCCFINIIAILRLNYSKRKQFTGQLFIVISLLIAFFEMNMFIIYVFELFLLMLLVSYLIVFIKYLLKLKINCDTLTLLVVGSICNPIALLSSSFIEEEHQICYFSMSTFLLLNAIRKFKTARYFCCCNIFIFMGLRFLRKLNQTGDKWAFLPDLAQWFVLKENYLYLHIFVGFSLISVLICCRQFFVKNRINTSFLTIIFICIYILKMFRTANTTLAQIIWLLILFNIILTVKQCSLIENLLLTWILISCLLLRPYNIILVPYCICTSFILYKQLKISSILIIVHLWLSNVLFFCHGQSNSLASVDVASGYVGLDTYKPVVVILQVLCHTYSLPVLVHLLLLKHLNSSHIWKVLLTFRLFVISIVFTVTYFLKHHLFVWSVFAPKLLVESSHSVVLLIEILFYYFIRFVCSYKSVSNKLN